MFSSTMFAVEKSPTEQPARVNGTHGAGVIRFGVPAGRRRSSEYVIVGVVSWPAVGRGSRVDDRARPVGERRRRVGRAVRVVGLVGVGQRLAVPVAVEAGVDRQAVVGGVRDQRRVQFENTVPLPSRKFSRCGICSRSDGTFGLSRKKWTLSNTMLMTCLTPLPSWQPLGATARGGGHGDDRSRGDGRAADQRRGSEQGGGAAHADQAIRHVTPPNERPLHGQSHAIAEFIPRRVGHLALSAAREEPDRDPLPVDVRRASLLRSGRRL